MKQFTASMLVILFFTLSAAWAAELPAGFSVYFNDPANNDPKNLLTSILTYIDSAHETLEIAVYSFSYSELFNALCAKALEIGAENIRVIVDCESKEEAIAGLSPCGITVKDDLTCDSNDSKMHHKFVIVDHKSVLTGSTNFTLSAFSSQANNAILIDNEPLANEYLLEFEEMWEGRFSRDKDPNLHTQHLFNVNGIGVYVYFNPYGNVRDEMMRRVDNARYSIDFSIYCFTDNTICTHIVNAKSDYDVRVRGLFDESCMDFSSGMFNRLSNVGCDVRRSQQVCPHPTIVHHKFMIIDQEINFAILMNGSANLSGVATTDADNANDENELIIQNKALADIYYEEFIHNFYGTHEDEEPYVDLVLNQNSFTATDVFHLEAKLYNSCAFREVLLFVALNIGSDYWFAPEWNYYASQADLGYYSETMVGGGSHSSKDILELTLPDPLPAGGPFLFLSVLTDTDIAEVYHDVDTIEFRFD